MAYTITGYSGGSIEAAATNSMIKMEPASPSVSSSSSSSMSGGKRKRNASQASLNSMGSDSRKLKKYEMDPSSDPSVKNAIAARFNRLKKKNEFETIKALNQKLQEEDAENKRVIEEWKLKYETQAVELQRLREEAAKSQEMVKGWMNILEPVTQQLLTSTTTTNPVTGFEPQSPLVPAVFAQEDLDRILHNTTPPEMTPYEFNDEDESYSCNYIDPLLTSIHKDEDLPSEPEQYSYFDDLFHHR